MNFSEMLVKTEKYARAEEGYDAHTHQVILPGAIVPGTPAPMATLAELAPTLLSTSSSASTLGKHYQTRGPCLGGMTKGGGSIEAAHRSAKGLPLGLNIILTLKNGYPLRH